MSTLKYISFSDVNLDDFINLLNKQKIREHLIEHELFDQDSVSAWIKDKISVDSIKGCQVRAIIYNNQLAGWCGIQLENEQYEIAIVIDDKLWGIGKAVFKEVMSWAKDFGHQDVFIHFLHTRPEYKFLRKIAINVYQSELLGSKFTTYQLAVE